MNYKCTILGCGSSGGVPRVGMNWGACDPANSKNRRLRCSLLVERNGAEGQTSVLIDTSPDFRAQILTTRTTTLDGVLYTHDHADHTHGIDDLRMIAFAMRRRVNVYFDEATRASLMTRFGYCFETPEGSPYMPILNGHLIDGIQPIVIEGAGGPISAQPILQQHGSIPSLGFRFGNFAYSPDVSDLPDSSLPLLEGLDVWIVDALRYTPHESHFSVKQALKWVERLKPKRTILTHMTSELDYDTLLRELPAGVEPAYDGMTIQFD
ncbi:phosphoribosyl 1,2-cyclic phosphodiesterase [Hyphomicrobium methylovorum]|uniref:MBL fold metallo-hydrolase n=1 Tax=Hyphomicrobium methylovorum TaxID=84 RepID=UPI0015E64964|nr:MBL fold metallo-hydrolase [Hyphomicrobium methylovorum]MBA2127737.1 phosphoribosyl 1,2-cyclic phosphodiesterase [Hyphomicrobium methylovorum]